METVKRQHWTETNTADFVYRISSDFVGQLEKRLEIYPITRKELAQKIGVSDGRVSQVFNNPGNLTLRNFVQYSRALGMKIAIVAYDDNDPNNENGPVNSDIFNQCWIKVGKPRDFFDLAASANEVQLARPIGPYFYASTWGVSPSWSLEKSGPMEVQFGERINIVMKADTALMPKVAITGEEANA